MPETVVLSRQRTARSSGWSHLPTRPARTGYSPPRRPMMGGDQDIGFQVDTILNHPLPTPVIQVAAEQNSRPTQIDCPGQPDNPAGGVGIRPGCFPADQRRSVDDGLRLLHRREHAVQPIARFGFLDQPVPQTRPELVRNLQPPCRSDASSGHPVLRIGVERDWRMSHRVAIDHKKQASDSAAEPLDQLRQSENMVLVVVRDSNQRNPLNPHGFEPVRQAVPIHTNIDQTGLALTLFAVWKRIDDGSATGLSDVQTVDPDVHDAAPPIICV